MGSINRAIPAHRLSHQQILGHTRTLCLALAEAKIQCIRGLIREKKFIKDLIFTLKHLVIILAMSLISEIACLRLITVLLLIVLLGLSFYILYDALVRCREIESKLTHEISEMSLLTTDDSDTENEEWKIVCTQSCFWFDQNNFWKEQEIVELCCFIFYGATSRLNLDTFPKWFIIYQTPFPVS